MDFTESNIRQFVLNIIGGYQDTLISAVMDMFKTFTVENSYRDTVYEENIHYFNGWKTTSAYKVNKRVVIRIYGGNGEGPFLSFGKWKLNYKAALTLRDFDVVMSYFDGMSPYSWGLVKTIEDRFAMGESKGESAYFKYKCHKRGTIHLEFKDLDILRRLNLVACRGKGWLPDYYGTKDYGDLSEEEQDVVDEFEGCVSYQQNRKKELFHSSSIREALPAPA